MCQNTIGRLLLRVKLDYYAADWPEVFRKNCWVCNLRGALQTMENVLDGGVSIKKKDSNVNAI